MKLFNSIEARDKFIKVIIIIGIFAIISFYLGSYFISFFDNPMQAKETIQSFGIYAPIVMIGLLIIVLLLAFVSQIPLIVTGGFAFGAFPAIAYTLIGFFIGGTIAFLIAKKLGRPFVKKIITQNAMSKLDNYTGIRLNITLFVFFLIPLFPDALCYIAGLTNIKYKTFVAISLIGRLPTIFLFSFAGHSLAKTNYLFGFILLGVILICGGLILIYHKRIENKIVTHLEKK